MSLYDFTPKDWKDDPDHTTPILSTDLERIEAGVAAGVRGATEAQAGNVELASPSEMTTGTDLIRVPAVKRVVDFVNAQITTALASIPSAAAATETAAGIVELATATEITTGTDLGRVASVKRMVDYVTAAIAASASTLNASITALSNSVNSTLAGKADKSGSIQQFADVSDVPPTDQQSSIFDSGTGVWTPTTLADVYATKGSDGRLDPTENPRYYKDILVINEGDLVPSAFPASGIVLARQAAASLIPTLIGYNDVGGQATISVTLTQTVEVGDYLLLSLVTSDETTQNQNLNSVTVSAGAASYTSMQLQEQAGTVKVFQGFARCTAQIPSGSTVTWTVAASRTHLMAAVCRAVNLAASSVLDGNAGGGGSSNTTMAKTVASIVTTNPNDLALMLVGINSGTPTGGTGGVSNVRTIAGTNGWLSLTGKVEHVATSSNRALYLFYKVLTTPQNPLAGTITFDRADDGTTGAWAGVVGALKAA